MAGQMTGEMAAQMPGQVPGAMLAPLPPRRRFADAFVVFAVTVLSLALGAWFLLQLGLALWSGTIAALVVYTLLLSLHLLVRRSFLFEAPKPPPSRGSWVSHATARADAHRLPVEGEAVHRDGPAKAPLSREVGHRPTGPAVSDRGLRPPVEPRDPFHFRPSREPAFAGAQPRQGPPPLAAPQPDTGSPVMSVEVIQDLIKKLADELNTAPPESAPAGEGSDGGPPAAHHAGMPPLTPPVDSRAEAPSAPSSLDPQLARIAEAIAAQRVEVLLEPIHALAEGRPRHVEVSMRLVTADGAALDHGEFSRTAKGTELMPRIDAARVTHATRVARRLGDRGRQGSVLVRIDGNSLADESFLAAAEAAGHAAKRLVLSVAQSEVRAFSSVHMQALKRLAAAGLRFALEEVVDLDMDLAALKTKGVDFVKLDAPHFLEGLPAAGGRVSAADVCRHLAEGGLTLVVGRIEDEWLLARVLGFGVLFGKGALFGEPRVVRDKAGAESA
jgi:cyclic-di-GMP phosphodiesterase, flagellum assembly factor TipF